MSKADKNVCFELLQRGLRYQRWPVRIKGQRVFTGPARNWPENTDPEFLKLLAQEGISPETEIIIFDQEEAEAEGEKRYCVTRKSDYRL